MLFGKVFYKDGYTYCLRPEKLSSFSLKAAMNAATSVEISVLLRKG